MNSSTAQVGLANQVMEIYNIHMKRQIPYHGWCFVCGHENPNSIGITMFVDDDGTLTSKFTLTEKQQGPPGHVHGGASAAILDEAMGLVVWAAGHKVAAANSGLIYIPSNKSSFLRNLPFTGG